MTGNQEYGDAVENTLLVFTVSSDVCVSLLWRFNISGQSLFPGGEFGPGG